MCSLQQLDTWTLAHSTPRVTTFNLDDFFITLVSQPMRRKTLGQWYGSKKTTFLIHPLCSQALWYLNFEPRDLPSFLEFGDLVSILSFSQFPTLLSICYANFKVCQDNEVVVMHSMSWHSYLTPIMIIIIRGSSLSRTCGSKRKSNSYLPIVRLPIRKLYIWSHLKSVHTWNNGTIIVWRMVHSILLFHNIVRGEILVIMQEIVFVFSMGWGGRALQNI